MHQELNQAAANLRTEDPDEVCLDGNGKASESDKASHVVQEAEDLT